ncbi:hypothetical protein [Ammoniphilus sp. CFH 90114]|uniref:hypothetical protein n=1 Tax=Ammoniphilus sp. CFH 90114 TaxID=2493665 RepID=UPI00100E2EFE|nr:hypothetical protein [Ammoniphilus sp. CFH 90114]RXT05835.1 hypothetical protein EIZ39_17175 [Ammoniphilus sp. CFH 90114]
MSIEQALERFRYALFLGVEPPEEYTAKTQEEYIEHYEQQIERDPAKERKLITRLSAPLLQVYRKQVEQLARMEQLISGDQSPLIFSDEDILEELYDELSNIETEEEWVVFKSRVVSTS